MSNPNPKEEKMSGHEVRCPIVMPSIVKYNAMFFIAWRYHHTGNWIEVYDQNFVLRAIPRDNVTWVKSLHWKWMTVAGKEQKLALLPSGKVLNLHAGKIVEDAALLRAFKGESNRPVPPPVTDADFRPNKKELVYGGKTKTREEIPAPTDKDFRDRSRPVTEKKAGRDVPPPSDADFRPRKGM